MGQPMSSSYENRWLSAGDDSKKGSAGARRKSITSEDGHKPSASTKENTKKKENTRPHNGEAPKKAQKDMTKAERRALQEKQRLEKQNRAAAGLPKSAKQAAELEAKKGPAAAGASGAAQGGDADANKQNKKKALSKNQQNQVPWLLHLDAPKTSDALTKDLHPAVLQLGLYFSNHKIVGSNARCVAMLEIFSKVRAENHAKHAYPLTRISKHRSFQSTNLHPMQHSPDTFKSTWILTLHICSAFVPCH